MACCLPLCNPVRTCVSRKKRRYVKGGYNLDMAYIVDDRVLVMGFPSVGLMALYRNPRVQICDFMKRHHEDNFKVYNFCCEPRYQYGADIYRHVGGEAGFYPFKDHNTPPLELIPSFCDDAAAFLSADKAHVTAMHCKAGKGRAGLMCICLLMKMGHCKDYESALTLYNEKRTKNSKGLTLPSQKRYAQYYQTILQSPPTTPLNPVLHLNEIRLSSLPFGVGRLYFKLIVNGVEKMKSQALTLAELTTHCKPDGTLNLLKLPLDCPPEVVWVLNSAAVAVEGDVLVQLWCPQGKNASKKPFLYYSFHTYFMEAGSWQLEKTQMEKAHKDKNHKKFAGDFTITHVFDIPVTSDSKDEAV